MNAFAYVGSYTHPAGHGRGIYVFKVEGDKWNQVQVVDCVNPSFFCFNNRKNRLYVANEFIDQVAQQGEVSAYAVDGSTGKLTLLNKFSSLGVYPCHVVLDPTEQFVFVSNYLTGSVVIFRLEEDGSLKANPQLLTHEGTPGPNKPRQEQAHAHMVAFDVDGSQRALVVDLGLDKSFFYRFDTGSGKLVALPEPPLVAHAGSGPRHAAQSQDGRFYYVTNELDSTVSVFSGTRPSNGGFQTLQTISAVPEEIAGKEISFCAELTFHPNGKFLYASNRGHHSITVFSVDKDTGLLTVVEYQPTLGQCPRHFFIDSEGKFLYAANQNSDSVVVFRVDTETGKLIPTGQKFEIPSPVCVNVI